MMRLLIAGLMLLGAAPALAAGNQPGSHIVEGYGGVPLVVQQWGNPEGPPILFIHGFSYGANAFKHQIGEIAATHRLIALDLRGHGLSAKPWTADAYTDRNIWAADIAAVLKALDVERPLIVGWSFGGHVALNYLRACGADCASGLVLAGSLAGLVQAAPPVPPETGLPRGDARADNYHALFDAAAWTGRLMTATPLHPQESAQLNMTFTMMPPMVRRAMAGLQLDNRDLAPRLQLPVMLIHGSEDGSVPASAVAAALALLPGAESRLFPGAGHMPFAEQPERFNREIMGFARRLAAR